MVSLWHNEGWCLLLGKEGEVKHIGDGHLPGLGVHHLCRHSSLNVVILQGSASQKLHSFWQFTNDCILKSTYLHVADLWVEVQHGSNLNRSSEPDIVHVETPRPTFAFRILVSIKSILTKMKIMVACHYQIHEHWPRPVQKPASWWNHQRSCWTWMERSFEAKYFIPVTLLCDNFFTCFCSEAGKQSGSSAWHPRTRQS